MDAVQVKLARTLAHVKKPVRDKGVQYVRVWLLKRQNVSELDLLKLWKGLFYCTVALMDTSPREHSTAQHRGRMDCMYRALAYHNTRVSMGKEKKHAHHLLQTHLF